MIEQDPIRAWVRSVDWPRVGCVVVVGKLMECIVAARQLAPAATILVFDPDGAVEPGEGYAVLHTLASLRSAVSTRQWPQARIEHAIQPELRQRWAEQVVATVDDGDMLAAQRHLTEQVHSGEWAERGLAAIPHFIGAPTITALANVAEGTTGVVVGSGPSLEYALPFLREHQERLTLAACQSSVPALEAAGITPQIICAVEHRDAAYDGLPGLSSFKRAIFAAGLHTSPVAFELGAEHLVLAPIPAGQVAKWVIRNTGTRPIGGGGSVATVAYEILVMMGCQRIIGVGIDCTTARGAYADGIRPGTALGPLGCEIPAWGGGTVQSHYVMDHYRHFFESATERYPIVEHINASKGGARIAGWREVDPAELEIIGHAPPIELLFRVLAESERPDWAWLSASIDEQTQGAIEAEAKGIEGVDGTSHMIESLVGLVKLGASPASALAGGMAVSSLEEWASFPTLDGLRAILASADRLVRGARQVRAMLETLAQQIEVRDARAA